MTLFGQTLFADLVPATFAALLAAYFFAFFVKGSVGLGAMTPAVLCGALVIDPHHAVLLAVIANGYGQLQFLPEGWKRSDRPLVWRLAPAHFAGIALGIWIFGSVGGATLSVLLGLALAVIVLADQAGLPRRLLRLAGGERSWALLAASGIGGLITGITGAGGLFFLAVFLRAACPDPRQFRASALLLVGLGLGWRIAVLTAGGFVTVALLLEAALLLPVVYGGGWLGSRLFRSLSDRRFQLLFRGVVVLAAASLAWRGLHDALG